MTGRLSGPQLAALYGRTRKPWPAITQRSRGESHACEWLEQQMQAHLGDSAGLRDLLHERWSSRIEFEPHGDAPMRSKYCWGWDLVLDHAAAIIQGDDRTIKRFAGYVSAEVVRAFDRYDDERA